MQLHTFLFWPALLGVAAAAFRWGGPPERVAAAAYVLAALLTVVTRAPHADRYRHVSWAVVTVDLALLAVLLILVVRADRWWPIFSAALQAATLVGHLGKELTPGLRQLPYAIMTMLSSYPTVAVLALAVWAHQRRLRRSRTSPSSLVKPTLTEH